MCTSQVLSHCGVKHIWSSCFQWQNPIWLTLNRVSMVQLSRISREGCLTLSVVWRRVASISTGQVPFFIFRGPLAMLFSGWPVLLAMHFRGGTSYADSSAILQAEGFLGYFTWPLTITLLRVYLSKYYMRAFHLKTQSIQVLMWTVNPVGACPGFPTEEFSDSVGTKILPIGEGPPELHTKN